MQFHFHVNQSNFHKNGFALKTRFETEAQGNSEMAYFHVVQLGVRLDAIACTHSELERIYIHLAHV